MRVLIADDHALVRDGLVRALVTLEDTVEIAEADSLGAACLAILQREPDVALVDLNMPGMNGLDGLRGLRSQHPTLPLVVVSASEDAETIRAVLALGVMGFVPKTATRDVVQQAIRLVLAGGIYVPTQALGGIDAGTAKGSRGSDAMELTPRQLDVLRLLVQGLPNKTIATKLNVTVGTVKLHLAALLRVLKARNRTEAALRAQEMGLCD